MSRYTNIGGRVQKDLYQILEVSRNATTEEIKVSFRKLAMVLHPDRHDGDQAKTNRFREVSDAYAVLSDEMKRRQYDLRSGIDSGFGGASANVPPGWYNKNRRTAPPPNYRKVYAPHPPPRGKWSDTKKHSEMHYGEGLEKDVLGRAFQRAKKRGDVGGKYQSPIGKGFSFENEEWNRVGSDYGTMGEQRKRQQEMEEEREKRQWNSAQGKNTAGPKKVEFNGTEQTSEEAGKKKEYPKNPYSSAQQGPQTVASFTFTHNDVLSEAKQNMQRRSGIVNMLHTRRADRIEIEKADAAKRRQELSGRDAEGRPVYRPIGLHNITMEELNESKNSDKKESQRSSCTIM